MDLIITPAGTANAIYGEEVPLAELGTLSIVRASTVEPTPDGQWQVDLAPVGGPQLGPFARRSDAIAAEVDWLRRHWLGSKGLPHP